MIQAPEQVGGEGFDDEMDEKSGGSSEFAAMLEESFKGSSKKKLKVGEKIKAEILVVGREEIFVATGTMNDGQVARRDLLDAEGNFPYKVGDKVDLFVVLVKGSDIRLSPKPTAKNLADDLYDAFEKRIAVEGRVVELCKGGVRVQVMGKLAFCPISQLDVARTETGEEHVGKRYDFLITQVSEGGRNIVVSRRRLLDSQREASTGNFLAERKVGDIVEGRISRLEKFGAFIELAPGIDGLAHISELSWSRVENPADAVSVGQQVTCKILKIETKERKVQIGLSLKQTEQTPWERFPESIKEGAMLKGKVTRCAKFGAFVELAPGIEGLVPMSEMSFTKRIVNAEDVVTPGQMIEVKVLDVNAAQKRISLSIKEAGSDPLADAISKNPVGTIVEGVVEKKEPFGLFIRIAEGVTGLLPKGIAAEFPDFPFEKLRRDDKVKVKVLEIKRAERRVTLGPPQAEGSEDWRDFAKEAGSQAAGGFGLFGDKLKAALEGKTKKAK
jgi:small subunit ribosomal protein S1